MANDALGADPAGVDQADLDILNEGGGDAGAGGGEAPTEAEETPPEETTVTEEAPPVEEAGNVDDPDAEKEKEPEKEKDKETPPEDTGIAKKIKAKYPEFFKEFPDVRKAIFQNRAFSEVFPTVEEAKEVAERVRDFDEYEQQVMAGDPTLLFKSIADSGPEGPEILEKFSMNILPTIQKFSPDLMGKMLFPHVRQIFHNALEDAKATKNQNLIYSIGHISQYLWNSKTLPELKAMPRIEDNPEALRARQENDGLKGRLAMEFQTAVIETGLDDFRKTVDFTFNNDKRFTPIERDALVDKIVIEVRNALVKDQSYTRRINAVWRQAAQAGHDRKFVPRVVNTFLGGAKSVLPSVRATVVQNALKRKGITQPAVGQQTGGPRGGGPSRGQGVVSPSRIDYNKTSDMDILGVDSSKITLKKR